MAHCREPEGISLTPQEEQLLNSLVERVNQTQLQEKDPDAELLLNRSLGQNPDSLYILAQTVLVQNIALEQAKAQVAQLQQQAQQAQKPQHAASFLGSLLGHRDPDPAPALQSPPYQPVNPQYAPPAPPPRNMQPEYQPQYLPVSTAPPSFLRGAMQTAAGVAAGALAFEGVEAVLHGLGGHPGYGWGGGGFGMGPGFMGGGFERPVEETVINNYYDDPNARGEQHHGIEQGSEHHFHESADPGGAQLSDANYTTSGNDQRDIDPSRMDDSGNYDNSGFDNSKQEDGSGFDDNSSYDDGGGGGLDSGGDVL
jgi:hypothetical protein